MMKPLTSRFLAMDVRPRRVGYAVFETPGLLLDFGVTRFISSAQARIRTGRLLRTAQPMVVVLRGIAQRSRRNRRRTKAIMQIIRRQAKSSSLKVAFVSERALRDCFRQHAKSTKYQVAISLAVAFPELAWRLPPRRKAWETENWQMAIFDAVALGVAHIASKANDLERAGCQAESF